ncbi:hypothetical protein GIB67_011644 [Kingdonia uniflora]|uniref:Protein kinase domain-containing protein n=1 Tax=Kingdonia uniflora TaxID=39325 RepID=A0A7J7NM29_9MAGN|nr:hypothetical protein GIB67_011644 [Kingdonia uniflora]
MDWTRGKTIGRGSFATVSAALVHRTGEVFAVKSVEYSKSELLQREDKILSSIKCPHIVSYKGCDVTNENGKNMYNLFMEYVSGGAVSDVIQKSLLDEFTIKSYMRSIILGLEYLHLEGLVHCDIKGSNILIGLDGAKIADLGCAKWINEGKEMPISGTPLFMAPEVARGDDQGFAADIWAIGCTVIEMATGHPPWVDVIDPVSALYRIGFSGEVPEFPSFLSNEAKDFLSNCLRKDPKERMTATQLLKHPFLDSHSKQIQNLFRHNSPTSILDSDFWDSMGETESPLNLTHIGYLNSNSPIERLKRLSCPITPNWTINDDWVTIRCEQHAIATTSGSDSVWVSDDEEAEELYEGSSDELVNNYFRDINSICSISTSRRDCNSFSRRDFVRSSNVTKHEHFMLSFSTILLEL